MATMQLMARRHLKRSAPEESPSVVHDGYGRPPRLSRAISGRAGLLLCLLGVLGAATSVLALGNGGFPPARPSSGPPPAMWTVADASTVKTSGPAQLVVQTMSYAPGQTSGWHSHPGVHLVTVISGTLTVYGPECQPRRYGPGEPYIGGDSLHLAGNESEVPVEMGVTYLTAPGQSMTGFRTSHEAPSTCPVR